jgi:hypothetical protein
MSGLASVRAKLKRAEQNLNAAKAVSDSFIATEFYGVRPQPHRKELRVEITQVSDMDEDFGLLVGDAAHDLRSALDHVAFAFAKPRTPEEEQAIQFPIVSKRSAFPAQRKRRLSTLPRRARAAIERLQPYHSRKNPRSKALLWLQAVNNWDKHRALLISVISMESSTYQLVITNGGIKTIQGRTWNRVVKPGAIIASFKLHGLTKGTKVKMDLHMTAVPIFDKRMPKEIRGLPVMHVMSAAYEVVKDDVLPLFENFL